MKHIFSKNSQIQRVKSFEELISTPFHDRVNALCWKRELTGDFGEIVEKLPCEENMVILNTDDLNKLELSEAGQMARNILINDFEVLKAQGASPILNLIKKYEHDEELAFFPRDVYSFHVDRSPVPTHTFLCTYYGEASELVANEQVEQKILIPEIREELKKMYDGPEAGFETFLTEHFFDLHYQLKPGAKPVNLGIGNMWRLAVDHPESKVLPCVHRAPEEKPGEKRLLLIC